MSEAQPTPPAAGVPQPSEKCLRCQKPWNVLSPDCEVADLHIAEPAAGVPATILESAGNISITDPTQGQLIIDTRPSLAPSGTPQDECKHDFKDYVVCCKCGQTAAATGDCHHCDDPMSLVNGRCWWCLKPLAVAPSGTEPATDKRLAEMLGDYAEDLRSVTWLAPVSAAEMNTRDRWLADQLDKFAALAALQSGTAPTTDRCWWCGGDYTVGTHSMEFGCNGEARVLSRDTETP